MIYLLHGDDEAASYLRLQSLCQSPKTSQKVTITSDNLSLLSLSLLSQDLFETPKIIICENLVSSKKISAYDFGQVPDSQIIILWEGQQVFAPALRAFQSIAKIENFKLPQTLFYFLDSISPNPKRAIFYLCKLTKKTKSLTWQLENRLLLLIFAKLNMSCTNVSQISGKNIAPWQWEKVTNQAKLFNLEKLKVMFHAVLKIETLIKTNATAIPETTLISLMFNKYLAI